MTWIESFKMAISAIGAHKLRSILTLVGIVAGVAAIIAVMTGVSVVQSQMEAELSVLGNRTFQVMKFPMGGFQQQPQHQLPRDCQRWPPLTMEHVDAIRERVEIGRSGRRRAVALQHAGQLSGRVHRTQPHGVRWHAGVPGEQHPLRRARPQSHRRGRGSRTHGWWCSATASPRSCSRSSIPIGKTVKVDGHKFTVQGVFAEKKSAMGGQFDSYVLMPISAWTDIYGDARRGRKAAVDLHHRAIEIRCAARGGPRGDAVRCCERLAA